MKQINLVILVNTVITVIKCYIKTGRKPCAMLDKLHKT